MFSTTIASQPVLFQPERAEKIAAAMTEMDEDGWTYRAEHDPKGTGYSRVRILDEDGEDVGLLNFNPAI